MEFLEGEKADGALFIVSMIFYIDNAVVLVLLFKPVCHEGGPERERRGKGLGG